MTIIINLDPGPRNEHRSWSPELFFVGFSKLYINLVMNVKLLSNGYGLSLEVTVVVECLSSKLVQTCCVCKRLDKFIDQTNKIILLVFGAPRNNFGEHSYLSL